MFKKIMQYSFLVTVCGCAALAPIGPIVSLGVAWVNGEASKYYASNLEEIHFATKNVLQEFNFKIIEEKIEENIVTIKTDDEDKFKIKIIGVRENITKLSIRINMMGDKPYAELIYRHVDKQPNVKQFVTLKDLNKQMDRQRRLKIKN